MALMWLSVVLLACMSTVYALGSCDAEQDPNTYMFGYGFSAVPYEYINDDGELAGIGYDVVRSVCKIMNRKCVHYVFYDYSIGWSGGMSEGLNNRWYSAQASYLPTKTRLSAYSFFGEYLKEQALYIFVRSRSNMDTLDEVKRNANKIGFRTGYYSDDACLGDYLGQSVADKAEFYPSQEELEDALSSGAVDAMFVGDPKIEDRRAVKRVGDEAITCASAGPSFMVRKDEVHKFAWFDEGLAKIRENGDYDWICNIYESSGPDPRCL